MDAHSTAVGPYPAFKAKSAEARTQRSHARTGTPFCNAAMEASCGRSLFCLRWCEVCG